ncbi:PP2C family protein-serine/threonine phosphatase [Microcoleus sp. A003_D6]|uniref:PP2C family protein-serine/threonine phosphatase n=1 Tax=Microcoleus sp. A003_D6 TaxID=3055266 RepID=UPI003FA613AA
MLKCINYEQKIPGNPFNESAELSSKIYDEASKKMASGNLDHKIILDNRDELGQVVGAFNKIADALVFANQEITVLNDRLKAENMRMSAELDVTRKIQQMLLPKDLELNEVVGLDIAGFMEAADEVGGDYYDVLQHEGRVKIGIGDVTVHGLESGVLMIMVQTAVRTLLAYNEPDPVRFLSAINSVIYDNVGSPELVVIILSNQKNKLIRDF